ncbi:MAG: AAA family ATPase [Runella zeae]
MNNEIEGVYLSKVTIKDFNCFQGEHQISFTRPDGRYQQWNVILGNNNTGKTTILRLLGGLEKRQEEQNPIPMIYPLICKIKVFKGSFQDDFITEGLFQIIKNEIPIYNNDISSEEFKKLKEHIVFYSYGTSRRMSDTNINDSPQLSNVSPLFSDNYELANAEEWLLQLDYAAKNGVSNANAVLERLKAILSSGLLPDVKSIELKSELDSKTNSVRNYALFETDYGKVRLKGLGYGYQATMAWVVDLAKKLFERYPNLDNPLTGAAIVLVDEIDLHLHPDWQRKIISYLSGIFPNTQFIVTAHSPLIVQSAENVNLIILEKGADNHTHIRQEFGTFKGWTVEEILQDLMGLGDKTLSDTYLKLLNQFEEGLDSDDYGKASAAYEELLPLLHPNSSQRKLLKLQLGAIAPASV